MLGGRSWWGRGGGGWGGRRRGGLEEVLVRLMHVQQQLRLGGEGAQAGGDAADEHARPRAHRLHALDGDGAPATPRVHSGGQRNAQQEPHTGQQGRDEASASGLASSEEQRGRAGTESDQRAGGGGRCSGPAPLPGAGLAQGCSAREAEHMLARHLHETGAA